MVENGIVIISQVPWLTHPLSKSFSVFTWASKNLSFKCKHCCDAAGVIHDWKMNISLKCLKAEAHASCLYTQLKVVS